MLTVQLLKELLPDTIFASGFAKDAPGGLNMRGTGRKLRWVATRGGIHDWAIYCYWNGFSDEYIQQHGDKVHDLETVKSLVPCDQEALEMYRQ
jgi:hypothetical protein